MHHASQTRLSVILLLLSLFVTRAWAQIPDTTTSPMPDTSVTQPADSVADVPDLLAGVGAWPVPLLSGVNIPDSLYPFHERRSGADFIRDLGTVFIHELGQGGLGRHLSVQGLPAGTLVFTADGFPLSDPSGAPFNPDIYPVEFSERVEYAPPGTGFIRTLDGTAGAVNFVSSGTRAFRPLSRIRYSQSAYGYSHVDGSLTQDVARGLNVTVGANHTVFDGRFENSKLDYWGGRARVRYDFGGAAVYISDNMTRWERGLNEGISLSTPDSLRFDRIRALVNNDAATEKLVRHDFRAGTTISSDSGNATYVFETNLSWVYRGYRDDRGGYSADGGPAVDEARRSRWYGFRIGHDRLVAGQVLSLQFILQNRRVLSHPSIGDKRSTQTGLMASADLTLLPGLSLVPMARFDTYLGTARFSFGGDALMRVAGPVSVRGAVSHAYRYPSFLELSGIGSFIAPAQDPVPEQHDAVTAGVLVADSAGNTLSADLFYREIRNRRVIRPAGGSPGTEYEIAVNGVENRRGVTVAGTLSIAGFAAEVSADWLVFGKNFLRETSPAWNVRTGLFFRDRLIGGHLDLKAGFQGRYFSGYDGESYDQRYELFIPADRPVPPAAVLDFVLVAGIGSAHVHFIWENLLNREYITTVFYPMDDRALRFGVTWDFVD